MNDLFIFVLLFVAIAIGWFLGRRGSLESSSQQGHSGRYFQSLDDLLSGRPDGAIDAFINGLEVSSETVETHFALGTQLRQKGELERAVRVHQNLLAGPALPLDQMHLAHLELARDYISGGLLDRAEQLLLELVRGSSRQRLASQRHLLEIYESERDWPRAIEVATTLLRDNSPLENVSLSVGEAPGQQIAVALAHYYCELASEQLALRNIEQARDLLHSALVRDRCCARASIMLGELEYGCGRYESAVRALRDVRRQDPDYVPETVASLRKCYLALDEHTALNEYLQECLATRPGAPLVVALAEDTLSTQGRDAAGRFLAGQLCEHPSLRGLAQLVGLQLESSEGRARENLELLQQLVDRLVSARPAYRCDHCGFSGRHLHWNCPGCKYWGSIKGIGGSIGC